MQDLGTALVLPWLKKKTIGKWSDGEYGSIVTLVGSSADKVGVITKSSVWLSEWVAILTCWIALHELSKLLSWWVIGSRGWSTWMLKSPAMIKSDLVEVRVDNNAENSVMKTENGFA